MINQSLAIPKPESGVDYATELARQPGTVLTVDYDDTGRITGFGGMPEEDLRNTLLYTQRKVVRGVGKPETHYVEFVGEARAPVLRVRPALEQRFDKSEIGVREPATISDLAPAAVTFDGPVKGAHQHPGGDLVVGWTVPGIYVVTVEAFPFLPTEYTLTVGAAS
jgi:hypothetical protein